MMTPFVVVVVVAVVNLDLNPYKVFGRARGQSSGPCVKLLTAVLN